MSILPARLAFKDGVPYSEIYQDIYHARAGGLEQSRHVFLAGNYLPERWRNQEHFAILETGFGIGLNFLSTWAAWREDRQACRRLHFVAVEKHPFPATDLVLAHAAYPTLKNLAHELHQQWPSLLPGYHRLFFDNGRVVLTLIFGDANEELRRVEGFFHAFYLDGFSPAKNPDLWSNQIAQALARCAAPGATLATWSVANSVCKALDVAGFDLSKQPGFADKRHCLTGLFRHQRALRYNPPANKTAIVIGAGIAGSSIAERLAGRDWQVDVFEARQAPGMGASGNLAGVMRPLPSADDNRLSQLTRAGFLATKRHLEALRAEGLPVRFSACGVFHAAQNEEQAKTQAKAVNWLAPPPEFLQFLDPRAAQQLLPFALPFGGWLFPSAGWAKPATLCIANLARFPLRITTHLATRIETLQAMPDGTLEVMDESGNSLARASVVIIACGVGAKHFSVLDWLPQQVARGQVTHLPFGAITPALDMVLCGHGYLTPAIDGVHVLGATHGYEDMDTTLRSEEHLENLAHLAALLPANPQHMGLSPENLAGRVGLRPISPDRLPIVGAIPRNPGADRPQPIPGLWCLQGFGARGIVWSALMAELLVSQILGEPLPLPTDQVRALSPARRFRVTPGKAAVES